MVQNAECWTDRAAQVVFVLEIVVRRNREQQSYRNWRVASKAFECQTVECSSDSIVQKNRPVARSWKCSVTKPETTKLPEIMCRFESVRISNCNVLYDSIVRKKLSEWIDLKWCAAIKVFEFYTSFRLLVWFDHAEQAICSSFSEMFCDEIGSSDATGSGVSVPYRKWCVASLSEVVCRFPTGSVCRFRSTGISNCCVMIWFDRAEQEVVVRETDKTRNERSKWRSRCQLQCYQSRMLTSVWIVGRDHCWTRIRTK